MSSAPSLAPSMPLGQAAEHLQVKLRPDLIVQPQFYEGMTHYVIKDPIALKYFRFKVEEYFLLQQFDGKQTLQDVKKAFRRLARELHPDVNAHDPQAEDKFKEAVEAYEIYDRREALKIVLTP